MFMIVFRTAVVFALLATGVADGQNVIVPRTAYADAPNQGITVTGHATATATPDHARVTVQVFGSVGGAPVPGSVPLDDAANALIDALKANGVADAHEALPFTNLNTRSVVPAVIGTVAKPTRERLEEIARNVVKAIPDRFAPAFANAQVQVALFVDDCSADEARAERDAFADAKARAMRLASAADVKLGPVIAISATQSSLPLGCTAKPDNGENGPVFVNTQNGTGAYGPLVVPITMYETVTFAIARS
jgi:uncharacterized protein YggE